MKKGFTLIEVLGVIVVLGIIAVIVFPVIDKSIKDSRARAYEQNVRSIERAALDYSVTHALGYDGEYHTLDIAVLKGAGLLEDKDIENPNNKSIMGGCVVYRWIAVTNQYKLLYSSNCEIPEE